MTLSDNETAVFKALYTNNNIAKIEGEIVPLSLINDCGLPVSLDLRSIIASLGGLQRKKLVIVHGSGVNISVELTKKGIRKVNDD